METKKLIHLYLDWNVFKFINQPRNEQDSKFAQFIMSIKDYIYIAYSPIHISGLTKNFDESKWDYIEADCSLISKITNKLCIYYNQNHEICVEYQDPLEMFKDRLETNAFIDQMTPSRIYQLMDENQKEKFSNDFYAAKKNAALNNSSDTFSMIFLHSDSPEIAFEKLIVFNQQIQTDPEAYIALRQSIHNALPQIKNLSQPEKDRINKELKSRNIDKTIDEINPEDIILLVSDMYEQKFSTPIGNAYTFKELLGITTPEKINKKNTFKNVIDDSLHLEMAKYSLYYITEDKSNILKSRQVSCEYELMSEVYTIEEANKFIKVSLVSQNNGRDSLKNGT